MQPARRHRVEPDRHHLRRQRPAPRTRHPSGALFLGEEASPARWCAAALLVGGVALTSCAPGRRGAGNPVAAPAPTAVSSTGRPLGEERHATGEERPV
ncbi:hypothetical protein [Streptomyces sp. NPDC057695]|uniref:hypothetical protein n=1 Tax=Streptomyces sp. NPDC057695 TaxID=3346217 RepID=UPI003693C581